MTTLHTTMETASAQPTTIDVSVLINNGVTESKIATEEVLVEESSSIDSNGDRDHDLKLFEVTSSLNLPVAPHEDGMTNTPDTIEEQYMCKTKPNDNTVEVPIGNVESQTTFSSFDRNASEKDIESCDTEIQQNEVSAQNEEDEQLDTGDLLEVLIGDEKLDNPKDNRPRSSDDYLETVASLTRETSTSSLSSDVKRKRGRPRKHPQVAEFVESATEIPKRKRGRPRKNPVSCDDEAKLYKGDDDASIAMAPDISLSMKRKRGRPRKDYLQAANGILFGTDESVDDKEITGIASLMKTQIHNTREQHPSLQRRKRGRPRKSQTENDPIASVVSQSGNVIQTLLVKRKKGRPRKYDSSRGNNPPIKRDPGWILNNAKSATSNPKSPQSLENGRNFVNGLHEKPRPLLCDSTVSVQHCYGLPCQEVLLNICGTCHGDRHDELKEEPILLCDGCNREFHLQCCVPELLAVPEDDYYCLQCDKLGSSADLMLYFQAQIEKRIEFVSSKQFVTNQLRVKQKKQRGMKLPLSELRMIPSRLVDTLKGHDVANTTEPQFLIGKPVRLLCCNIYHNGRIIDWRKVSDGTEQFWPNDVEDIEYLVRFPSGMDNRKELVQQWIILEEHSMAVGCSLIWARNDAPISYRPGIVWLRTSLELFPIQSLLSHEEGHISFLGDDTLKPGESKTIWGAVTTFDEEYREPILLDLKKEAVPLADASMSRRYKSLVSKEDQRIRIGLATVEWEEQRRVKEWSQMRLSNTRHRSALCLANEIRFNDCATGNGCPSTEVGLDRLPTLRRLDSELFLFQDNVVDSEFVLVDPSPSLLQNL